MTTDVFGTRDMPRTATRTVAVSLAQVTAGLALASAVVHVLAVSTSSSGALVMAVFALACLPCSWHLWRKPTVVVWAFTAALDTSMLALHSPPLARAAQGHLLGHGHAHPDQLAMLAIMLVSISLLLSTVALTSTSRRQDCSTGTTR